MDFQRIFVRPFLVRATDRSGLVPGALAEAAEADPALADHLLRALAAAVPPDATAIASRTKGFAALRGLEFISADVIPLVGRTT